MKPQELRNLSADELETKAEQFRTELFNLRFQAKVGKLEKSSKIRMLKRDLARALTIRKEWSAQKPPNEKTERVNKKS
ncbi:MAG: 50S ribosomal protein L29 [Candidatus Omnitrophica bacterium]|nr:50S ribosomal protein L29 [Candidatus Omnitrophota bacterium]